MPFTLAKTANKAQTSQVEKILLLRICLSFFIVIYSALTSTPADSGAPTHALGNVVRNSGET